MAKERIKNEDGSRKKRIGMELVQEDLKGDKRKEKAKNGGRRKRNIQGKKGESLLRRRGAGNRGGRKKEGKENSRK